MGDGLGLGAAGLFPRTALGELPATVIESSLTCLQRLSRYEV